MQPKHGIIRVDADTQIWKTSYKNSGCTFVFCHGDACFHLYGHKVDLEPHAKDIACCLKFYHLFWNVPGNPKSTWNSPNCLTMGIV